MVSTAPPPVVENSREAWSARARTSMSSWEACGWSRAGQQARMVRVALELDPRPGERLLDFGCGTGALTDYLASPDGYVGYDPAAGMVDRAQQEHPAFSFQSWEPLGEFDLVACVGPFNLPHRWSKQHTWHELRRLWERTRRMLVASLYAGADERCLVYTVDELYRFAAGAGAFHRRVDRWRGNDLLLVMQR